MNDKAQLAALAAHTSADPIDVRLSRYSQTPDPFIGFQITQNDIATMSKESYAWVNSFLTRLANEKHVVDGYVLTAAKKDDVVVFTWNPVAGPHADAPDDTRLADHIEQDNPFRPRYRRLTLAEASHHDDIKNKAFELLSMFRQVPNVRSGVFSGEDQANLKLAQRHLEDAVYRAVKALTA